MDPRGGNPFASLLIIFGIKLWTSPVSVNDMPLWLFMEAMCREGFRQTAAAPVGRNRGEADRPAR